MCDISTHPEFSDCNKALIIIVYLVFVCLFIPSVNIVAQKEKKRGCVSSLVYIQTMAKQRRRRSRRRQKGKGLVTAQAVYGVLKAAGKHARSLKKNNLFRRMTVNRFGIPPSMQKRMYTS